MATPVASLSPFLDSLLCKFYKVSLSELRGTSCELSDASGFQEEGLGSREVRGTSREVWETSGEVWETSLGNLWKIREQKRCLWINHALARVTPVILSF